MKILFVSSEVVPFSKTGGLADVVGALPGALTKLGHQVTVISPLYGCIDVKKFKLQKKREAYSVLSAGKSEPINIYSIPDPKVEFLFIGHDKFFGNRKYLYQEHGVDYPDNFERFLYFNRAVLEYVMRTDRHFDVIHVHDWQASLIPAYLKTTYKEALQFRGTKTLLTVHNLAYQGFFDRKYFPLADIGDEALFIPTLFEYFGHFSFLKSGLVYADAINTVSKKYASEIQTDQFGCGLNGLLLKRKKDVYGILNGIDDEAWNPGKDKFLAKNFTVTDLSGKKECKKALQKRLGLPETPDKPLVAMISRLADQKGFDLVFELLDMLLTMNIQWVVLGTGDKKYHQFLEDEQRRHPESIAVKLAFDEGLAHEIEAGADIFLMPSKYEPCGLNQMMSLRYGTVPVVHATGGLDDTVNNFDPATNPNGNGFKFTEYNPRAFFDAIQTALNFYADKKVWQKIVRTGMAQDFSWKKSAKEYAGLYEKIRNQ